MNNSSQYKYVVILLILIAAFYAGALNPIFDKEREKRLAEEIKSQLRTELRAEIKKELLAEIKKENQDLAAAKPSTISTASPTLASSLQTESLDQVVHRITGEVIKELNHNLGVSDKVLDQYVASGGIEPNLEVSYGVTKNPQQKYILLAENNQDGAKSASKTSVTNMSVQPEQSNTIGEEPKRAESIERTLQQRGSSLLPRGTFVFEPAFSWAHFSSNRINIQGFSILPVLVIGNISTQELKRDIFINQYSFKYGLFNNFQTEIRVPFRGEFDRISNSTTSESTRSKFGIGDIDISASRQIGWEHGLMPDLIASVGFKTVTGTEPYGSEIAFGTGHYALRTSLIAAKSSDPAVIFGSMTYSYNFERDDIDLGTIKPGDSLGFSVGTAIALSYQMAISFSFDQSLTFKTQRNGSYLIDSFLNSANFKAGVNWAIDERRSVDFSVGFGLTTDSPDVTVELRFPMTF